MTIKQYTVYFHQTAVGQAGVPMVAGLQAAHAQHGNHLPEVTLGEFTYQVRDLHRVGRVWKAVFAQLRDDAPNVVSEHGRERPLDLQIGDRLLEKCHFLYFEDRNIIVWQNIRGLGGTSTLESYLSRALEDVVGVIQVQNSAELDHVLAGQVYELQFAYARPHDLGGRAPRWNQNAFDMMASAHAAKAKFMLRAPRNGSLATATRSWIREMINGNGFEKVRVKLTDESDPVELFLAPLRDRIRVELPGRYPDPVRVYEALAEAYDRQRDLLPRAP